jgi:hypothetical protein
MITICSTTTAHEMHRCSQTLAAYCPLVAGWSEVEFIQIKWYCYVFIGFYLEICFMKNIAATLIHDLLKIFLLGGVLL